MDPISQAAIGAALPQSISHRQDFKQKAITITWLGCLSGMAPDIDVFIRSSTDPLLFLEFHRQFTHSLFFIPIGAFICTLLFSRFSKPNLDFKQTYLVCLLAYSTHALLDSCTTYGTQLLWPLTDQRFAWNTIAVVDPVATLPLFALVIVAAKKGKPIFAQVGLAWFLSYLALGWWQSERAQNVAEQLMEQRGHATAKVEIKPGFANIILWKSVYLFDDTYYVDAVRVGLNPFSDSETDSLIYIGTSAPKLNIARDLSWLDTSSQQGIDVERFRWFSNGFLAMDPDKENFVIDMRYSMLPNEIKSLWGIRLSKNAQTTDHVTFESDRDASPERMAKFWAMLRGEVSDDTCIPASPNRNSNEAQTLVAGLTQPNACAITL